jgi:RNA polymerase sigma factor for flagellar operon FliA
LYMRFARVMAAKLYARRVYATLEFADYLQLATVGLIEAVDRFDPERGNKFETYAASRISGAILNGISVSSEIQEQIAARRRIVRERLAALQAAAPAAGDPAALFAQLADLAVGLAVGFALEDTGMYQGGDEHYVDQAYSGIELRQIKHRVADLVTGLPEQQKQVITGHYLQQQPFEQIALKLQLSRGRVSQIHKEALGKLRDALQARGITDVSC